MIDEQLVVQTCEIAVTGHGEPGLMFRKIHVQRLDGGWYVICVIYKRLRHQYDTRYKYEWMKRKLTIVGEFFVDDACDIRHSDYCHDVPPIDPFGDHQFEYTKSKLFSGYREMKKFLSMRPIDD